MEIYDPMLMDEKPPTVLAQLKVVDRANGSQKIDSGGIPINPRKGSPMVPVGLKLPVNNLTAGAYRLDMVAVDSAGRQMTRSVDFDIQ
jgi:hypothetical protein